MPDREHLRHFTEVLGRGCEVELVFRSGGTAQAQAVQLQDALEVGEQHLDLLPLASRYDIGVGYGDIAGPVASSFIDRARDLPGWHIGRALLLECTTFAVLLPRSIPDEAILIDAGPRLAEVAVRPVQAIAARADVAVVVLIIDEVGAFKGKRAEYLAHYEPMTGLLNRATFTERLEETLQHRVSGDGLSVVFINLDDFKSINDTHGHEAGDELLKHVARCVSAICGEHDMPARTGGDEFTLAIKGRDEAEVVDLVEQLMHAVAEPILVHGSVISGRLSCGIYVVEEHVRSMSEVMLHADVALNQAKVDGKNTYRLFSAEVERSMRERRALERLVVETAAAEDFELHYQPLLHVQSGECAGFEALLRLRDGKGGFVPPVTFIPVLESTGLIDAVGKWVIEEATHAAATWPDHLFVAVNLSVKQFHHGQLVDQTKHAPATSGLQPERQELEVTESMLMENTALVEQQFKELRALGVAIAMDDFGTGYSSLGYLWKFGFDKLKIDRSFVSALNDDDVRAREILDTIIMLGHKLDMSVTAEGIETEQQAEILASLDCDHFQGYLYGKPGSLSQIAPIILRARHAMSA